MTGDRRNLDDLRAATVFWVGVVTSPGVAWVDIDGTPPPWAAHDLAEFLGDVLAELRERATVGDRCVACAGPIVQPARGRRRKYCGDPCRDRARRASTPRNAA